jgi:hypothetical protein
MEVGGEEYKTTVDGLTKLMDRAIEIEKIHNEKEEQSEKLKAERFDQIAKNVLTAVSILGGFALTVWGTKTSIKFEETGTITTIMGRGFINKLLPKK